MNFASLTPEVRVCMGREVARDKAAGTLYISPRLSPTGSATYESLLIRAIETADAGWLVDELRTPGHFNAEEPYTRNGKDFTRKISANAPKVLGEGEFNRFYCRGMCVYATAFNPEAEVEVYRAKEVSHPRPESQIGSRVKALRLLDDLRANPGVDSAIGVPSGPNSGLSVKLVPPGA